MLKTMIKIIQPPIDHRSATQAPDSTSTNIHNNSTTEIDLLFPEKGLHIANLNTRHVLPKYDELRITLGTDNGPDIRGLCETLFDQAVNNGQ